MKKPFLKEIPGYESFYLASKDGRIFSKRYNKFMKSSKNKDGYLALVLNDGVFKKTLRVHRIIAITFLKNHFAGAIVNHKNGIKTDNRVENLEWTTYTGNAIHAFKNKLRPILKGDNHPNRKTSQEQVKEIRFLWENKVLTRKEICKKFKLKQSQVYRITTYEHWKTGES